MAAVAADFPPWQTVYWYFVRWEKQKATETMLTALREQLRRQQGRDPQPSAGIIDSQAVKGADTVGRDSRGYDAVKRINGRKRFIVTDALGLLIVVADAGFAGRLVDWAAAILRITLHIVRKPDGQRGFAVIPRRGAGSGTHTRLADRTPQARPRQRWHWPDDS